MADGDGYGVSSAAWSEPSARLAGALALALTVTLAAAIATEAQAPDPDATARAVVAGFLTARTAVLTSGALFLVAMGIAMVFIHTLTSLVHWSGRERAVVGCAAGSGIVGVALLSFYGAAFAAIAASIPHVHRDADLVYVVYRVISATDDASGIFIALFVASIAYVFNRAGLVAGWLASLGYVAAAVRAFGSFDVTTLGGLPFAPFIVVGTALCLVWLALLGLRLLTVRTPTYSMRLRDELTPHRRRGRSRARPMRKTRAL